MISRVELIRSKEYWLARFQAELYAEVDAYLKKNKLSKTAFAAQLGVSKGYVSQLMNADFDHKISKLIEISLAIGKAPVLAFEDLDKADAVTEQASVKTVKSSVYSKTISAALLNEREPSYDKKNAKK